MKPAITTLCLLLLLMHAKSARTELFFSDSKKFGSTKMDIVIRETERRSSSSLVEITIKNPGSSVGSSFFILCSLRNLGQNRGYPRYIAKAEDFPIKNTWLVAFLNGLDDDPKQSDQQLKDFSRPLPVIDLEQFAPICNNMK